MYNHVVLIGKIDRIFISFHHRAVWINMPLSIFAVSLCALCGCVIYAFYADCDPISDGRIKKGDQVIENKIIYFYFLYMCSLNVL